MTRQDFHPRTPFASPSPAREGATTQVRRSVARRAGRVSRLLLVPLAAIAAAVAGLVYVLLLPICGIASIASAAALASWALVKDAFGGARGRTAPRG